MQLHISSRNVDAAEATSRLNAQVQEREHLLDELHWQVPGELVDYMLDGAAEQLRAAGVELCQHREHRCVLGRLERWSCSAAADCGEA